MITLGIETIGLGFGSIVWAEVVRDIYHSLAHVWTPLYRLHVWHHKAFRADLEIVDPEIYRRSQWCNDVPECFVMLAAGLGAWALAYGVVPLGHWGMVVGLVYTLGFLGGAVARGTGSKVAHDLTDLTHLPGAFTAPPAPWFVNRTYHWRHHFDNQKAYYSGTFTLVDQILGTALSLKGKTIAVTGASGTLGQALLGELRRKGAKVIALTSRPQPVSLSQPGGQPQPLPTVTWTVGQEAALAETLATVDILVLNHGVNVQGDRTPAAIETSYEVNTFSQWRLLELFLGTVRTNAQMACKEVWVNTSEAEVNPAFSPLYELSKRTLGDLVTLRRLDAPCVMRKLILGPFRSDLNPVGVMSADWVAKQVVNLAQRDFRNIIVTINPLTYGLFPLKELAVSLYFRLFSRSRP
ncbi:bifunctional sterol desaturase/short chain dehydrogenase [Prochlorothrix hollandica]|uniref:Sterol desaturase n=1 Tax=Prochlorothrix hollandica PCC 9006 = CALU 1027 TaxID=317619 RepID=A0A0M2PYW4_PROHO|nr:bifunctional sterol desaturase/short chain dehydrogenase [Prochlorothrix hollandica]KKI99581.1 sterol desaturase [Prochlorothrix hollandica PCC 9006 = CALU 1027]